MKRILIRLLSIPPWFLLLLPLAISAILLTNGVDGPSTVIAVGMGTALVVGLLAFIANLAGLDPQSGEIAHELATGQLERDLLERWLRRSRHYRYVGGTVGLVLGLGFEDNGGLEEGLVGLLAGIAIGGALAELHILGSRQTKTRSADLTRRRLSDYVSRSDSVAMAAIALAGLATLAAALVGDPLPSGHSLTYGVISIAIVGATLGLQTMVVRRARPAVSEELRRADDLLRRLAATQGFARPAIAVALISLSAGVADLGNSEDLDLVVFVLAVAGLVWYARSRQGAIARIARRSQAVTA